MARQTNAVEGGQWLYNEQSPRKRNLPPFLRSPISLSLSPSFCLDAARHHRHDHHHTAVVILS